MSWPPMEALEEWIEEGPAHAARTVPERARFSPNFAMGLPALNMEEELTKRKARAERFRMTEGPPTAMRDTKKAEASAQMSPRKRGREDPEKGNVSFLLTMFVFIFFFFSWRHDYLLPVSIANNTKIRETMFIAPRKHPVS